MGSRKVDMHLHGLEAMGADVEVVHGFVNTALRCVAGAPRVVLEFPRSARPRTSCVPVCSRRARPSSNTARRTGSDRPRHVPRSAWAAQPARGTSTIEIEGVEEAVVPADTEITNAWRPGLLMACGIAGGEIELVSAHGSEHLEIVVSKLSAMGMRVSQTSYRLVRPPPECDRRVDTSAPGVTATDFMPITRHADDGGRGPLRSSPRTSTTAASSSSTDGCRREHRRSPHDGAQHRRPVGRARDRFRRTGRRHAGHYSRAWSLTARRSSTAASTSTAATATSRRPSAPSVPTSDEPENGPTGTTIRSLTARLCPGWAGTPAIWGCSPRSGRNSLWLDAATAEDRLEAIDMIRPRSRVTAATSSRASTPMGWST